MTNQRPSQLSGDAPQEDGLDKLNKSTLFLLELFVGLMQLFLQSAYVQLIAIRGYSRNIFLIRPNWLRGGYAWRFW
jgi:hypothetical protein